MTKPTLWEMPACEHALVSECAALCAYCTDKQTESYAVYASKNIKKVLFSRVIFE